MKGRRFIAGAVCPACGEVDRLVADEAHRRCVSCGFTDARPAPGGGRSPDEAPPELAKPLRLVDD